MTSLFISYSRKDIEAARRLAEDFRGQEIDFWIDWEGIPPTVDWWKEIEKGIEGADVFLFMISPDSAKSKVCQREVELAAKNGKRLIPLVMKDIDAAEVPIELQPLNWIFMRAQDDFSASFEQLITAIHTDYAWVQFHRRLQGKALEWDRGARDNSLLLRGNDLQDAELQLVANASKEPHPTDLQGEYVRKSRRTTDRQAPTIRVIAVSVVTLLAAFGIFAFFQARSAGEQDRIARAGQLAAQSATVRESQFDLSILLANGADRTASTPETRSNLLEVTQAKPALSQYMRGHTDSVADLAFSPDRKILASASVDRTIILWDVATRQPLGEPLTGHTEAVSSLAFNPDGTILVSGGLEGTMIVWDVATGQPVGEPFSGHTGYVSSIVFSSGGETFVSGSIDGTMIVWDAVTRQPVGKPIQANKGGVESISLSPNGEIVASAGWDNAILLWDLASRQKIGTPFTGHEEPVNTVAFSPDGILLASGSDDEYVVLRDVQTHRLIVRLAQHTNGIYDVAFSASGRTLFSSSFDDTMIIITVILIKKIQRNSNMQFPIRSITQEDAPYLWDMLYYAAHMSEDGSTSSEAAKDDPHLNIYVKKWGRPGDDGVIAYDVKSSHKLGAAWLRLLIEDKSNYGYYNDETPELAIAVLPEFIGQGIGLALLASLINKVKTNVPAIVLTVRSDNPAISLDERNGFIVIDEVINRVGTKSCKMLLKFH